MIISHRFSDGAAYTFLISCAILLAGLILGVSNHLSFPGQRAQIEQLRNDAEHVSPATAEDVVGQVTLLNQEIQKNKTYNNLWWSGWAVPDGWDQVETIPIPQQQ